MSTVSKSYYEHSDPVIAYCSKLTVKQSEIQKELNEATLKNAELSIMLGAPEVLTFGANFLQLIHGKRVLDIGTYTGASAFAFARALPDDGEVYTFDISHDNYRKFGVPILSKCEKTFKKIKAIEGPALEELDKLIADGQSGKFDFAFIDADKVNYVNYYERAMTLLRSGGVIFVDNALWSGRVTDLAKNSDESTKTIDALNNRISSDERSNNALLNFGDGLHVAFKK